eukprot:5065206-Pyramimonas_sp.AAC.1
MLRSQLSHIESLEYPPLPPSSLNCVRQDEKGDSLALDIIRKTELDTDHQLWSEAVFQAAQRAERHGKRAWQNAKQSIHRWARKAMGGNMKEAHGYLKRPESLSLPELCIDPDS